MPQYFSLRVSGDEETDAYPGSTPEHREPYQRPHTPDQTGVSDALHPSLPPTPEAAPTDSRPQSLPDDVRIVPSLPPVKLEVKPWAKPQTLERNKLRLKEPKGIQDTTAINTSKWVDTLKRLSDLHIYVRLPPNQVRLLLLKPGAFDEDIYVSLMTVNDTELGNNNHPYSALSYHWGEGQFDNIIFVQEDVRARPLRRLEDVINANRPKKLKIKPNLYEALKNLRDETETVPLWVDALCINQYDEEELNEQVVKMALIYGKASKVDIWLGSDGSDNSVSAVAMAFIPKVIDANMHEKFLDENIYVKSWASLFELLKWSWFSRRWVIQELALAKTAIVHCGEHACRWSTFQTAIAIFCWHFTSLKPKLMKYFKTTQPDQWSWDDDSVFEIEQLGAKLLVDMTATLFRPKKNGSRVSTKGLETLVCSLSGFDTSDPRDTINALRNISKELNRPDSEVARQVPSPDYGKDLFEVYRDFVEWVIKSSGSLDILCRFWALKERKKMAPTTPRLVELPSWIQFVEDSAWGKGEDMFNGRQAGDSFVGLPDDHNYSASGQGISYKQPVVFFPRGLHISADDYKPSSASSLVKHDMSLHVQGVVIGTIRFRTDPFPDGIITKECLQRLGWSFNRSVREVSEVPDQLWQSLVADRGPNGRSTPPWYQQACKHLLTYQTNNGHINIDKVLRRHHTKGPSSIVQGYSERVKAVTWNRSFIEGTPSVEGHDPLVGFAPPKTELGDIVAILYGCSVPVILRPTYHGLDDIDEYQFVGEAYIYGNMDGEALDECHKEQDFKLV